MAEEAKQRANAAFASGSFAEAITLYNKCLSLQTDTEQRGIIFSNISACYLKLGDFKKALEAAITCRGMRPTWFKSHFRIAAASYEQFFEIYTRTKNAQNQEGGRHLITSCCALRKAMDLEPSATELVAYAEKIFNIMEQTHLTLVQEGEIIQFYVQCLANLAFSFEWRTWLARYPGAISTVPALIPIALSFFDHGLAAALVKNGQHELQNREMVDICVKTLAMLVKVSPNPEAITEKMFKDAPNLSPFLFQAIKAHPSFKEMCSLAFVLLSKGCSFTPTQYQELLIKDGILPYLLKNASDKPNGLDVEQVIRILKNLISPDSNQLTSDELKSRADVYFSLNGQYLRPLFDQQHQMMLIMLSFLFHHDGTVVPFAMQQIAAAVPGFTVNIRKPSFAKERPQDAVHRIGTLIWVATHGVRILSILAKYNPERFLQSLEQHKLLKDSTISLLITLGKDLVDDMLLDAAMYVHVGHLLSVLATAPLLKSAMTRSNVDIRISFAKGIENLESKRKSKALAKELDSYFTQYLTAMSPPPPSVPSSSSEPSLLPDMKPLRESNHPDDID